jgi:hypothetical protein
MQYRGLVDQDELNTLSRNPFRNGPLKKSYNSLGISTVENVKPKSIEWLWEGMIPKGKLTMFTGESGIGKTQILCSIAATITRGGYFPGEQMHCRQADVLYLSGEDDLADTLVPRFIASGGRPEGFHNQPAIRTDGSVFSIGEVIPEVRDHLFDHPDIVLWIIDPITAFCGDNFDNNDVTSVRALATKIKGLAEDTGIAILVLNHLTKDSKNRSVHRILGSGAWVHAPRTVLAACVNDGQHYFGKLKANISSEEPVYQYRQASRDVEGIKDVHYIDWSDEVLRRNKLSDFEQVALESRGDKGAVAQGFMEYELEDGYWHRKKDVIKAVQAEVKLSERQLERIAEDMNLESRRENKLHGLALWRLPLTTHGEDEMSEVLTTSVVPRMSEEERL